MGGMIPIISPPLGPPGALYDFEVTQLKWGYYFLRKQFSFCRCAEIRSMLFVYNKYGEPESVPSRQELNNVVCNFHRLEYAKQCVIEDYQRSFKVNQGD